jgi:hypothetical protein
MVTEITDMKIELAGKYALVDTTDGRCYQVGDWQINDGWLDSTRFGWLDGLPLYRLILPVGDIKKIYSFEDDEEFAEQASRKWKRICAEDDAKKEAEKPPAPSLKKRQFRKESAPPQEVQHRRHLMGPSDGKD